MPGALSFETARLRLLPFRIADLDEAHRLWTDPDMRRYLWDDEIISRETAREALEVSAASFESQAFGYWRVLSKGAPALIGFAGLRTFGDPSEVELLYGLLPAWWGRGLATEAARAVLRFGFEELGLARIFGRTDPPNAASVRLLQRCGMKLLGVKPAGGLEVAEYVLERQDFRSPETSFEIRRS
jgi:ribosomal-protein-alanine N-acetyltransferase